METEAKKIAAKLTKAICPNIEDHTYCPDGYIAWHSWAEEMGKTHKQRKCPGCGLYAIWEPRRNAIKEQSDAE